MQCDEFCLFLCTNPGERAAPHVLANSDSDADQALKLQVRDAVLEEGAHIFDGSLTAGEAEQAIEQALPQLERAARSEVMKRGLYV